MYRSQSAAEVKGITPLLQFCHEFTYYIDQLLMAEAHIGLSQFRLLQATEATPRCTQKFLATSLAQTEASVSRQTKILENQHMVTVHRRVEDKRARSVVLTPKGRAALERATAVLMEHEKLLHDRFPLLHRV
ncbi:winged helix-turn-helix transcriptional regulator [Candidatus Saccharibacteria bacterium]|nr:winged helix-turn-helix transcriptional regulator [Candidatus Saccharibacteria bacterium]